MIKSLFDDTKKYLNYFFDSIDISKVEAIHKKLLSCKGTLIFTGIGKSGFIANKIAMTMLSTGTKALFLPPIDALHGDIGIVGKEDVFIFFSKSGSTDELVNLIPFVKKRGASVIAVVCNDNSKLAALSDLSIVLPTQKELCPFNLAPTTSTTVQLIFGDILTIALMKEKNFSLNEYAINHPAGAIGRQISLSVEDLMFKKDDLPLCKKQDFVMDVLHELSYKKCGCLLVVDDKNCLEGIFTDGDLRRAIQSKKDKLHLQKIEDLMTNKPKTITKEKLAIDALRIMQKDKQVTVLPVVEEDKIIGLIRMHDIIKAGL
ncbi:MAG: KpsF/GutQ family sugar-phosphate isomerase [Chlamydiae bacterium]|nr:KpsF/GutQ family sugar-phosphate isomerase [Chlamydiota bacterium]